LEAVTAQQILSFITDIGVVPVVRTNSADTALKAIEAIYRGGIRSAEITMTVPGALKALERVADQCAILCDAKSAAFDDCHV